MSISGSLNNAITGLTATSRMAEVVSANLANALTEGYGRREVQLSSASLGGVSVDGIARNVDPVVLGERRLADASLNNSQRSAASLNRLEAAIGTAEDPYSIAARLTAFEQSLVSASTDPASDQRLELVVTRANELTQSLSDASRSIQQMRQDADADIARDIDQLNTSLGEVSRLNGDIARTINTGGDPGVLMDARQLSIDKIAEIVPVREMERPNGGVALVTTRGVVLLDGPPAEFSFTPTPTIVADMTYAGGVLGGLEMNGVPMIPDTGFGRLSGGSLESSFKLRDETLTASQTGLDEIAADLITRFEATSADPTLGLTDTGLLTDNGARFDLANMDGLASRVSLNSGVDPELGGDLSLIRDGVAATTAGPVGDSTQINRWLDALNSSHSYDPTVSTRTASEHVSQMTSDIGTLRLRADETLTFETARWNLLKDAELADGVDSDQELQKLLVIEQTYAANARLIQTASSMLQTLMEI